MISTRDARYKIAVENLRAHEKAEEKRQAETRRLLRELRDELFEAWGISTLARWVRPLLGGDAK